MRRARLAAFMSSSVLLLACGSPPSHPPTGALTPAVMPLFDPTLAAREGPAETWVAFPFPADHRRTADGHVRFDDFPNPNQAPELVGWLDEAQSTLDGFSIQGLAYVAFDGAIDASLVPTSPAGFLDESSPIALVDVTESSPSYGTRVPLRSHYWELGDEVGTYVASHTLGVGPAWGFPLREGTTYALVVRDSLRAAGGGRIGQPALLRALLADDGTVPATTPPVGQALYDVLRAEYAPLRAWLVAESIDAGTVTVATVFTTQRLSDVLATVEHQIAAAPAPAMSGGFLAQGATTYATETQQWSSVDVVAYDVYRGRYVAPNYQEGTVPYADSGGGLHLVDGVPTPVFAETIDFDVTVPEDPPDPALGCYPIVMYAHGTGGSRDSFLYDGTAGRLAARGMAAISIDQPLHGTRAQGMSFDVEQMTFNYLNAASFRTVFRQAAIDLFSLRRFARESLAIDATVARTHAPIPLCHDRLGFMGHSQGGITGAIALPFLGDVPAFVLSGAGGGLGITLIERKDVVDFQALIALLLQVPAEEELGEEHPIITLAQTLADVSDPSAYGRYFGSDTRYRSPASVLLTSGQYDDETPYRTAIALSLSAFLPVVLPIGYPTPDEGLAGLSPIAAPFSANRGGATTGFLEFSWDPNDPDPAHADYASHFVVFHRPEAIDATMHFLATATGQGVAEIRRDASADAL